MDSFWLRQGEKPLWPELEWSRPQQKRQAKKLVIIGGHAHGFDAVGRLYQAALTAGIGAVKAVLPKELKRTLSGTLPDTVFTDLTPEPKDQAQSKADLMAYADWADGVVLAQTGNNSKTALLVGDFLKSYAGPLVITDELVELLKHDIALYTRRPDTLFVLSFEGLQKLAGAAGSEVGFRHDMGLRPLVLGLRQLGEQINAPMAVIYEQTVVVAFEGRVVSTPRALKPDPIMLAAYCAVWWLQQPGKTLEALATAAHDF